MDFLLTQLTRFRRDERGSVIAEMVITLPMLIWAYMAMYVYWDAFRMINSVQKASYTISDMVSREMLPLDTNSVSYTHLTLPTSDLV